MPRPAFRVQYLCCLRPAWYDLDNAPETENYHEAAALAAEVSRITRTRTARVIDDAGRVRASFQQGTQV